MRNKIIISIISLIISSVSIAGPLVEEGDSLYAAAKYKEAAQKYATAIKTEGVSAELYYNLGDAYYRSGNISGSILAFERSLRLNPTFKEARENLEFVNTKVIDNPGERLTFLEAINENISFLLTPNAWAWLSFSLLLLIVGGAFLYYFSDNILLKKIGFFGGIVLIIFFIVSFIESFYSKSLAQRNDEAIITSQSTILSTSPRTPNDRNEEAMLLHEGTKVRILDSVSVSNDSVRTVWYDVKIDNAHRAWISGKDIEKI